MREKIPYIPLITLIVLVTASTCLAGEPDKLEQAREHENSRDYEKAEQVYLNILQESAQTDDALQAQEKLTCLYITWNKRTEAEAALKQLLDGFSQHEGAPAAVTHVADAYRKSQRHQEACELYNYVIGTWPQDEHAMWSQMNLAISNACLGNDSAATAAFEKLISQYSEHKLISKAVCEVADNYRKLKKHKTAKVLYQYVLANKPDAEVALWSQMGLAISNMRLGEDTAAQEAVDKLLSDFAEYEQIPIAACMVADEYRKVKIYENAFALYQYVVDNWPEAEHALWSQMNMAISNIQLGDDTAAQEAADKLLSDFAGDERLAVAGCLLADEYRKSNKYENASVLYQYVVDNWPDTEHTMWSQMGLAISNIALGDDLKAEAALGKLLTDFPDRKGIAQAINSTARQYRWIHGYEKGQQVYQSAIEALNKRPKSNRQIWSRVAVVVSNIALSNDVGPEAIDNLISDFADHPDLAEAIFRIGEQYYNLAFWDKHDGFEAEAKGHFAEAIAVWERIITELPPCAISPQAYYFSGSCYKKIGDSEKAIERYTVLVDEWPDYEYSWNAQYMIGCCYEKLARSKQIPMADAAKEIRLACEKLLTNYPDCMAKGGAHNLLKRWELVKSE